ncbi:hypothetical protein D0B32_28125 [Paraburkholderia sp. DHOC27]|nr:hypothetical protein D0B32_28125 [Paraburkholderia sp. DHOC27]
MPPLRSRQVEGLEGVDLGQCVGQRSAIKGQYPYSANWTFRKRTLFLADPTHDGIRPQIRGRRFASRQRAFRQGIAWRPANTAEKI